MAMGVLDSRRTWSRSTWRSLCQRTYPLQAFPTTPPKYRPKETTPPLKNLLSPLSSRTPGDPLGPPPQNLFYPRQIPFPSRLALLCRMAQRYRLPRSLWLLSVAPMKLSSRLTERIHGKGLLEESSG